MNYMAPISQSRNPVLELALLGISPVEIAERTGRNRHTVRRQLSRYRQAGFAIPNHARVGGPVGRRIDVVIPNQIHGSIVAAAKERGLSASDLVEALLKVIATEGLIDAVLDDADEA